MSLIGALLLLAPRCTPAPLSTEDEVLENIRQQQVGRHHLADYDLPEAFLRRVADRIIRSTYQDRYQNVAGSPDPPAASAPPSLSGSTPFQDLTMAPLPPEEGRVYRSGLAAGRPELRGFRLPLLDRWNDRWPFREPGPEAPETLRRSAELVATRLARSGLVETLIQVIRTLGVERMLAAGPAEIETLRLVGLPVDWLEHFRPVEEQESGSEPAEERQDRVLQVVRAAARIAHGRESDIGQQFEFRFTPSEPAFRVATESGEFDPDLIRVQLTRGDYWGGVGDGGSVDITRQLMSRLPGTRFRISIEERFVPQLQALASTWGLAPPERFHLLAEPRAISQWAQDNGKAGTLAPGDGSPTVPATLAPRYASRREDGSELVPAESFLLETLAASGHPVIPSPLLFQGGDLLAVRDPAAGERVLFVGEAEVYRNTALGLTYEQVLQAFRLEFGVDRCEVLPSISFHIDFDVSFRAGAAQLVAFVDDRERAARILVDRSIDALVLQGTLEPTAAESARGLLRAARDREAAALVADRLYGQRLSTGAFPRSLTVGFAGEDRLPEAAAVNFQRLLLALDILVGPGLTDAELEQSGHRAAYFRSLGRERELRRALVRRLEELGCRVVAVPSLSEGKRGMSYLNGIQTRSGYLMPAHGGFFSALDEAAREVFTRELDPGPQVTPIYCPESQRRLGGLHCSAAAYPATQGGGPG